MRFSPSSSHLPSPTATTLAALRLLLGGVGQDQADSRSVSSASPALTMTRSSSGFRFIDFPPTSQCGQTRLAGGARADTGLRAYRRAGSIYPSARWSLATAGTHTRECQRHRILAEWRRRRRKGRARNLKCLRSDLSVTAARRCRPSRSDVSSAQARARLGVEPEALAAQVAVVRGRRDHRRVVGAQVAAAARSRARRAARSPPSAPRAAPGWPRRRPPRQNVAAPRLLARRGPPWRPARR